ncbi:MAG: gamma-glutamylcyclotransferase [Betaproteobacteria bacterium]|nr:gamma-glutamylcyclotransferase [Betaproteobacteria bacterium]
MKPRPSRTRPLPTHRLSDEALNASITETLSGWNARTDLWLFAYGSLMWSPNCEYSQKSAARIFGYHRSFCLWSRINRGTPENPGLVLALEAGGSCHGFAYRIPRGCVQDLMLPLWKREMLYGSYRPRWLNCHVQGGNRKALAFVINPQATGYCGHLTEGERVEFIVDGKGTYGTSAEYLFNTVAALDQLKIHDESLHRLARQVRARLERR